MELAPASMPEEVPIRQDQHLEAYTRNGWRQQRDGHDLIIWIDPFGNRYPVPAPTYATPDPEPEPPPTEPDPYAAGPQF